MRGDESGRAERVYLLSILKIPLKNKILTEAN